MTASNSPPVYLRILTRPKKARPEWERSDERPNDNLWLVFDTETTTNFRQDLRFGIARVYAFGNLTRTVVFYDQATEGERNTISAWARGHNAEAIDRETFVKNIFFPLALGQRAVVVGFNLPFDLSRLAVDFAPKRNVRSTEGWTLRFVEKNDPAFAHTPGIRVTHVDSRMSFIHFTGVRGRKLAYRGAFVDLKALSAALTGQGHSLKTAGEALGCKLKKTEQDYHGVVNESYLDYCVNDVSLTAEVFRKCLARYDEFNLPEHPSRVFSSASLGKAAFRARGVRPPNVEDGKLLGRVMAAFYAGKVDCRVVGREIEDVAVLDFTSQYPSLYCLLGAERYLSAERFEARGATEEVRRFVDEMTPDDLLRRQTWENPLLWTLCEVEVDEEVLPLRSPYSTKGGAAPTIGWNRLKTEDGVTLPYLLPDVIAAKLLCGRAPKIVRAVSFVPVGKQVLGPISILGTEVDPSEDLVQRLSEARIKEKAEKREGWEARALGLKILVNTAGYGVFVEVNVKRYNGEMEVFGLDEFESFEEDGAKIEQPGELFSPLLGAMVTSGGHLLLGLLDVVAAQHEAEVVYCDTDSAFVTPSKTAAEIARSFDSLNPYSVPCPLLKDETEEKAPRKEHPKGSPDRAPRFFGLSSKRYCLFVRDPHGRPFVFKKGASDHGLGMYQVPEEREKFAKRVWERLIEAVDDPDNDPSEGFEHLPATAQFALTTPALLPRVSKIEGIRPFGFLTIRYLDPAALPDGAETFKLLPFHSPKEPAWLALADEDGSKTWAHIIDGYARHRDRKYEVGPDDRIVRRHVLVRRASLIGLGKEGTKLAARLKLGKTAAADPSVFIDWKRRLLAMGRAEARRLGLPWNRVGGWKRTVRRTGTLRGDALRRLRAAILAA